jgi:hypothetical protein
MNTKEISTLASRLFELRLLPSWIARSQEDQDDYGVDYEIEPIDDNGRASGVLFKAQVKGVESPSRDREGRIVFSRAEVARFQYYTESLHVPLIFVICDVSAEVCCWAVVQGNRDIETALATAVAENQSTFTLKLSASNTLERTDDCAARVLQAIHAAENAITLRRLKSVPLSFVQDHLGHVHDPAAEARRFRLWAGFAEKRVIEELITAGDLQGAYARARALFESPIEPADARLLGAFHMSPLFARIWIGKGMPSAHVDCARNRAKIGAEMLAIARDKSCRADTRRFIRIYARAARMSVNGQQALWLAMSERSRSPRGETLCGPITYLHRLQASARVARDFFRLLNAMNGLGADDMFAVMPHALSEIAEGVLPFIMTLRLCGQVDMAKAYADAVYRFLPFCVEVAKRTLSRDNAVEVIAGLGVRLLFLSEPSDVRDQFDAIRKMVECEPQFDGQQDVLDRLTVTMREAAEVRDQEPSEDEIDRFYAQQAAGLGVDLNDPDNEIAEIVRIGIKDRDPTRVAKHCEHIHVLIESYGLPGEMLGLPTAGTKRVMCLKYGHSVSAMRLDDAFESFRQPPAHGACRVSCDSCVDKTPLPYKWRWSNEWSHHQDDRLRANQNRPDSSV